MWLVSSCTESTSDRGAWMRTCSSDLAGRTPAKRPSGCPFFWLLFFTTGLLPFALRASMRCSPAFLTRAWARKEK